MTVRCANGHASEAEDYCDICGEPIAAATPPPAPVVVAPEPVALTCPTCGFAAAAGALFCENCGYDFTTGTSPEPVGSLDLGPAPVAPTPAQSAPVATTAPDASAVEVPDVPVPVASPRPGSEPATPSGTTPSGSGAVHPTPAEPGPRLPAPDSPRHPDGTAPPVPGPQPPGGAAALDPSQPPAQGSGAIAFPGPVSAAVAPAPVPEAAPSGPQWVVEVWIDPDWYAVQESTEPMPSAGPPALVVVQGASLLVGRHSVSRSIHPQIDCGQDSGVSRRHCELTTDGLRWWVEDLQSSNGTYVGPADAPLPTDPIPPRVRRELEEGDRVYVGAFSRLVVREALPGEV